MPKISELPGTEFPQLQHMFPASFNGETHHLTVEQVRQLLSYAASEISAIGYNSVQDYLDSLDNAKADSATINAQLNAINNSLSTVLRYVAQSLSEAQKTVARNNIGAISIDQFNTKLSLTGGTLTGFLTLHALPTANMHAANKGYVDTVGNTKLPLSGGTLTGALIGTVATFNSVVGQLNHPAGSGYLTVGSFGVASYGDGALRLWTDYNNRMMTLDPDGGGGNTTFRAHNFVARSQPSQGDHLTRKDYVDTQVSSKLDTTDGVATNLRSSTYPTLGNQVATKSYVDNQIGTTVTNVRLSAESSTGTAASGEQNHVPAGTVQTGILMTATGATSVYNLCYYRAVQILINGTWRNIS